MADMILTCYITTSSNSRLPENRGGSKFCFHLLKTPWFYCNSLIFILIHRTNFIKHWRQFPHTSTPILPIKSAIPLPYLHPNPQQPPPLLRIQNAPFISFSLHFPLSLSPRWKSLPTSYCLCLCTAASPPPCPTSGRMKCRPVAGW